MLRVCPLAFSAAAAAGAPRRMVPKTEVLLKVLHLAVLSTHDGEASKIVLAAEIRR